FVDRRLGAARPGRDLRRSGRVEAALGEHLAAHGEDLRPAVVSGHTEANGLTAHGHCRRLVKTHYYVKYAPDYAAETSWNRSTRAPSWKSPKANRHDESGHR